MDKETIKARRLLQLQRAEEQDKLDQEEALRAKFEEQFRMLMQDN